MGAEPPPPIFNFSFKRKDKIMDWGEGVEGESFSMDNFSWEAGDTIPQNSYIPYQNLNAKL